MSSFSKTSRTHALLEGPARRCLRFCSIRPLIQLKHVQPKFPENNREARHGGAHYPSCFSVHLHVLLLQLLFCDRCNFHSIPFPHWTVFFLKFPCCDFFFFWCMMINRCTINFCGRFPSYLDGLNSKRVLWSCQGVSQPKPGTLIQATGCMGDCLPEVCFLLYNGHIYI